MITQTFRRCSHHPQILRHVCVKIQYLGGLCWMSWHFILFWEEDLKDPRWMTIPGCYPQETKAR
jgi:hypothetical protein